MPGLKALITINGPVDLIRGFLYGTNLEKNTYFHNCEKVVSEDIVKDAEKIVNKTGTVLEVTDVYENVYNVFDIMMYTTRLTQRIHPAMLNCIGAGEFTYFQLYDIIVE